MRKTFFKKLLTVTTIAAMTLSSFGCSKETTNPPIETEKLSSIAAEELFVNTYNSDDLQSGDMDLFISMDADTYVEEAEMDVNTKLEMDFNVAFEDQYLHMKGDVNAEVLGASTGYEVDGYVLDEGDDEYIIYVKNPNTNQWQSTTSDNSDVASYIDLINIDKSLCKDFKVVENDEYYIAKGTVTLKDVTSAVGMSTTEFFNNMVIESNEEYDNTKVNVAASFNKETKILEKYELTINSCELGETKLNKMVIKLTINDVNNTKVEVPMEILQKEMRKENTVWDDISMELYLEELEKRYK